MLPRLKSGKDRQSFSTSSKGASCDHCWCIFDIDRSQLLGWAYRIVRFDTDLHGVSHSAEAAKFAGKVFRKSSSIQ